MPSIFCIRLSATFAREFLSSLWGALGAPCAFVCDLYVVYPFGYYASSDRPGLEQSPCSLVKSRGIRNLNLLSKVTGHRMRMRKSSICFLLLKPISNTIASVFEATTFVACIFVTVFGGRCMLFVAKRVTKNLNVLSFINNFQICDELTPDGFRGAVVTWLSCVREASPNVGGFSLRWWFCTGHPGRRLAHDLYVMKPIAWTAAIISGGSKVSYVMERTVRKVVLSNNKIQWYFCSHHHTMTTVSANGQYREWIMQLLNTLRWVFFHIGMMDVLFHGHRCFSTHYVSACWNMFMYVQH